MTRPLIQEDERTIDTSAPAPPTGDGLPSPALPERVGPYPILGILGQGGMGVVYLAADPVLERRIALKVLPQHLAANPLFFSHFQREAKLLASMNNPNIATIHSLEKTEDLHFLTMECIDGWNLADRLDEGALPLDEALAVCRQIAVALEAAHRSGVVHLDLKPSNVMATSDGLVKVLDFGLAMALARQVDESGEMRTVAQSQAAISGTPGYMSPEQIRGEPVDARTDIFAFGCILYESLCGRRAFPGDTIGDRMQATLETAPDIDQAPPDTPKRIRDLLERCLTKATAERLGLITKARQEIEQVIAHRAIPSLEERSDLVPNNLPAQVASFVGRETQKGDIERLLAENRTLTLSGVGGGGKTRLALEVARGLLGNFRDGVWLVELAPLSSADLVTRAVTTALRLRDEANLSPTDQLLAHLRDRQALLILDNCEHVVTEVARIADLLLAGCPDLRILSTSRERLGLPYEVVYPVPVMVVPPAGSPVTPETLRGNEAAELFLSRARAVNPSFEIDEKNAPSVAQICRRLDGIPLAIELAAARIKVLPASEIAKRLDQRFRLLGSGLRASLPHHQTLQTLIDWSYQHLTDSEQTLLRRFSLFAGGWTLDAAEAICAGEGIEMWEVLDHLTSLVDKSLVEVDAEGGRSTGMARYRMLETIREYSRERLVERGEGAEALERHRDYFLQLAETSSPALMGPEQSQALLRLSAEHENLILAIDMCGAPNADPNLGWRLWGALGRYWYHRGLWNEGRKLFAQVIGRPDAPRNTPAAAQALNWAGNLSKLQGDYAQARLNLEESLAVWRGLGDENGLASALNNLGNVLKDQGDLAGAGTLYEESLALQRKLGNHSGIALGLNNLAILAQIRGDRASARPLYEESLRIRRKLGDRSGVAASLNNLGALVEALGDTAAAIGYFEESVKIRRELGDRWGAAVSLNNLGRLATEAGDPNRARTFYEEGLATFRDLGDRNGTAVALNNLGIVASSLGDHSAAKELLAESLSIFSNLGDHKAVAGLFQDLAVAEAPSDPARAVRLLVCAARFSQTSERVVTQEEAAVSAECERSSLAALGEEVLGQAKAEALRWDEADAVAYALRGDPSPGSMP